MQRKLTGFLDGHGMFSSANDVASCDETTSASANVANLCVTVWHGRWGGLEGNDTNLRQNADDIV